MNVNQLGKECNGCSACYNICPQKCLYMVSDKEGFLIPSIDESICIECGACVKVCPLLNEKWKKIRNNFPNHSYAFKANSQTVQMQSTSGGFFSSLAKLIIEEKGIVYGAAYDENWHVCHMRADTVEDIRKLADSKYSQSELGDIFSDVKSDLEEGYIVLFSGTPCQVAGLKSFLKKEYLNLILVDLICHGVPSPKIWDWYIKKVKEQKGSQVCSVRHKEKAESGWDWKKQYIQIDFSNRDSLKQRVWENSYLLGFLEDLYLRECCYKCVFKDSNMYRVADISIGDFWGCEEVEPDFFDSKGVSLVLTNTEKGNNVLEKVNNGVFKETQLKKAAIHNVALLRPVEETKGRHLFWGNYNEAMELQEFDELIFEGVSRKKKDINSIFFKVKRRIKKKFNIKK